MAQKSALFGAASVLPLLFSAALAGDIRGVVTDTEGTTPIRGAEVLVQETGRVVSTGRDGSFRVAGLDAGRYTLRVTFAGAEATVVTVDVPSDSASVETSIALGEGDVLIVRGQRGQLDSAISQQRSADGIVTVLSADDIGQLPDENVAEAARRALGVSIANDQGEGRFISIRGINSNLNSTSVNGVRLTSPEATDRRVAMDVIDADVLKNIIINKTLTPDMDGDAIGGSIELETITGLDVKDRLLNVRLGGIYSELSEETGPKLSAIFADNFMEGRLGVALSAAYQSREFGSENQEVDGGWEVDGSQAYIAEEFELRNYDIERDRLSLAANIDFMATDNTRLYFRSLYNEFSDQEFRSRMEIKIEDTLGEDANGDIPGLSFDGGTAIYTAGIDYVDEDGDDQTTEWEIDRDIKDRLEEQTIWSLAGGFEHTSDLWTVEGSLSFTYAEEAEPNRVDANFDLGFDEPGQSIGIDVSNTLSPEIVFTDAGVESLYLDSSAFELDAIETTDGVSEDDELAFKFDVQRDVSFGQNPGFLKAGFKSRVRNKSYELDFVEYSYEGDTATLADFETSVDYPLDVFGPAPDAGAVRAFLNANINDSDILEIEEDASLEESAVSSYDAEEDVYAFYGMGQLDIGTLRLTGGVRVEDTTTSTTGNVFVEDDTDGISIEEVTVENDYTDVLPSIIARWNISDQLIIRASYYASIVRPNFGQLTPAGVFGDRDVAAGEFGTLEAGNPDLDRTESDNFDFLVEFYPTRSSIIQGGVFHKSLENLITSAVDEDGGTFNGLEYDELETFINLDEGTITGFEFGYQQALTMLPEPFDGLIAGLNYTYADSEATTPEGDEIQLPGQSEHIFNAILGYDKGPFDLRAAYSFKGENIDDVSVDGVNDGRVVLDQSFLDLSAKYELGESAKLYFEVKNVLDTPLEVVDRIEGRDFLNQYEEYGRTLQAGVRFNF